MTDTNRSIEEYSDRELLEGLIREAKVCATSEMMNLMDEQREASKAVNIYYNEIYARLWDRQQRSSTWTG